VKDLIQYTDNLDIVQKPVMSHSLLFSVIILDLLNGMAKNAERHLLVAEQLEWESPDILS
jgi:hypothetical protein